MIRIRHADLPAGLHIRVVAHGKDTIIYLVPGLTAAQRQAALRRARSSGRMGQGPRLPAVGVAGAFAVDRIRATVRNGAAAIRAHPAMFALPLVIILAAAAAYVSVSIKGREPQASGQGGTGAPIAAAVAPPPGGGADDPGRRAAAARPTLSGKVRHPASPRPGDHHGAGASPSPSPSAAPSPTGTAPSSPPGTPSPSPTPAPSAGGGGSTGPGNGSPPAIETCLGLGLIVCLSM